MIQTVKLLALDPGQHLGWAQLIVREGYPHEVRGSGIMHANRADGLRGLVCQVRDRVASYDVVAIEEPGTHPFKSHAAATKLYEIIGAIRAVCILESVDVRMIPDGLVKMALAGRENASKGEVHWAVFQLGYQVARVGRQHCKHCRSIRTVSDEHSPDAADAVAVGHVAADRLLLGL